MQSGLKKDVIHQIYIIGRTIKKYRGNDPLQEPKQTATWWFHSLKGCSFKIRNACMTEISCFCQFFPVFWCKLAGTDSVRLTNYPQAKFNTTYCAVGFSKGVCIITFVVNFSLYANLTCVFVCTLQNKYINIHKCCKNVSLKVLWE